MLRSLGVVVLLAVAACVSAPPAPARALLADLRGRLARVEAANDRSFYNDADAEALDVRPLIGLTGDEIGEGLGVRLVRSRTLANDAYRYVGFFRLPEGARGGGVTLALRFDGSSGSSRCIGAGWVHPK